ncbi:hypothetical protein [Martelella mediterranea]|uniref:Uncharacterized protein n=1 Tax=Martelella mediterranea TaxID=293089 RepID=A0A4R3NU71_9HYPH|nr:hypothetical protein [Martelella mediterranea]TCT41145.1 hypothetical protein EDC90_1007122 [Martelella mediterranea]
MYKRVVVSEAQGVTETDFERLGTYPQSGFEFLGRDLLQTSIVYADFTVSQSDTVTVQIAPGRVYDSGKMYASESVEERSVAAFVPVTAGQSVICLVVAQGQEVSDDLENRYYERAIDAQNPDAGTQQTVEDDYRTKNRKVVLTVVPGTEAARPIAPTAPIGSVAVAEILIGTSGIQTITMRPDGKAQTLEKVASQQQSIQAALAVMMQNIEGLRADQAGIKAQLAGSASKSTMAALAVDMALIKDRLDIADDGAPYWADRFLDRQETDDAHVDFDALVEEGIRFNHDGVNEFALSLYNPNDPNLMHAASGLICPKYQPVEGIAVTEASGEMALGGLSVQNITVEHLTESRERIRYGSSMTICNNSQWWHSGHYDPIAGIFTAANGDTYKAAPVLEGYTASSSVDHQAVRLQRFWTDTISVPYDKYKVNEQTISGVVKAESFLIHQERWTPRTWLGIKAWGDGAEVTAVLVECRNDGTPDPKRALASVTKTAADFTAWPERTYFTFDKPRLLKPLAGSGSKARAYAIMYFVTGDVTVATADGSAFLGGNLFTSTDGIYFDGDVTRDLIMGIDFCAFEITQMPIRLNSWQLTGGIESIDILAPQLVPSAANVVYEINVNGSWKALSAQNSDAAFINGITALYETRVVFTGTEWGMPIIEMGDSRVRLTRPKDQLTWLSTDWALGEQASEMKLRAVVGAWDAARHTMVPTILSGVDFATETPATETIVRPVVGRSQARPDQEAAVEIEWTFDLSATTPDTVKLKLEAATNNARVPFHVEWLVARKTA